MEISLTEENYLKAIYKLQAENAEVTTNQLSSHLNCKAASVTDMLRKLALKKLIKYQKYQGVSLISKGEKIAISVIRKHRLWEVFLTEKLNFTWDEVHEIAEQLEHIQSDKLIERLDIFLGRPKADPHGDLIPNADGKFAIQKSKPLSEFSNTGDFVITGVEQQSKIFLNTLSAMGIAMGEKIVLKSKNNFDNSMQIKSSAKKTIFISDKIAANILVKPVK
jgi:DtxR family Mn-dependent transcriptional regulator